ncbi:MAG: hypothetical protein EBQ82_09845 [Betaproteobacteria bacterium]|nr:hypothetical protein [Betaproteobacteria bacterium]NBY05668.1 hypothetical protein [Betaproteobacteria bacterium]
MEYHFSLTQRWILIFSVLFVLFVTCIFFIGIEVGKNHLSAGVKEPIGAKSDLLKNIEQGASGVQTDVQTKNFGQDKKGQ